VTHSVDQMPTAWRMALEPGASPRSAPRSTCRVPCGTWSAQLVLFLDRSATALDDMRKRPWSRLRRHHRAAGRLLGLIDAMVETPGTGRPRSTGSPDGCALLDELDFSKRLGWSRWARVERGDYDLNGGGSAARQVFPSGRPSSANVCAGSRSSTRSCEPSPRNPWVGDDPSGAAAVRARTRRPSGRRIRCGTENTPDTCLYRDIGTPRGGPPP
jgi:hypothetical protein